MIDETLNVLDGLTALDGHESSESLVYIDAGGLVALALRLTRNSKRNE